MNTAYFKNIGKHIKAKYAASGRALAAGTGDNTEVTGDNIDRDGYGSGKLVITAQATLAEAATLSFTVKERTGADDTACTNDAQATLLAKTVEATGGAGGSTEKIVIEIDIDLSAYDRFVGFDITPDLSAGATDVATWAATFVKGGAYALPAA